MEIRIVNKVKPLLSMCLALSLSAFSIGTAVAEEPEVLDDIAAAAVPVFEDPGLKIEEMIENFEVQGVGKKLRERSDRGEIFYTTAQAFVQLKPESRDWGNARVMAFKEALLKAQAQYIEYLGVSVTADAITRLFDDQSRMPEFTREELRSSNKLMEVLNKAVAVASGEFDQQLIDLGIDPADFKAAEPEKRAQLFERSVSETVVTRARQSLTGVVPIKTLEAYNSRGDHVIAVAIVASDNFRQFVYDVTQSKGDIAPNQRKASSKSLLEVLRAGKVALIDEFGIRRMYDEQGYPVLVSFGQSSNSYRGEDSQRRSDGRELAYTAAKAEAYGNFAYLFNSTGNTKESSSRKMINERIGIVTKDKDGITETEETNLSFVQAIDKEIKVKGKVSNLPGTRELFRWSKSHPVHGHEINGVVYVWHPVSELNARGMREFKPKKNSEASEKKLSSAGGASGISQSRDLMSADDF